MALNGNLRDFSLTQLLNVINLAQKTGKLVINNHSQSAVVLFREGKLAYAGFGEHEINLIELLFQANVINKSQFSTIKMLTSPMEEKELGLLLINAGYISQDELIKCLQNHYIQNVERLFTWSEGAFRFEDSEKLLEEKIPVRVDLENIILEGTRHVKEWEHLTDEIPNLQMALKISERPSVDLNTLQFSPEEWRVIRYANPQNTIERIAEVTKMDEMGIRRVILGLLQAGIVEIIRPASKDGAPSRVYKTLPGKTEEEKKNIIARLIDRIRRI